MDTVTSEARHTVVRSLAMHGLTVIGDSSQSGLLQMQTSGALGAVLSFAVGDGENDIVEVRSETGSIPEVALRIDLNRVSETGGLLVNLPYGPHSIKMRSI